MSYIPFFKKTKVLALSVAMFASFAAAGEGNINYYGQLGVHKTQSAQTLGHGRLGLGFFLEGAGLGDIIQDWEFSHSEDFDNSLPKYGIKNYLGMNAYVFPLSLGLSDIFDFSISVPFYGDYLKSDWH